MVTTSKTSYLNEHKLYFLDKSKCGLFLNFYMHIYIYI